MIVLGIETATLEVGVAIADPDGLRACFTARASRQHAEHLHVAIDEVCRASGVTLSDLGAIAVDIGPGLFTGIRVGIAAAKALGFALGIGIVAVTGIEILARAARSALVLAGQCGEVTAVVPVLDVRRGELAWSPVAGVLSAPGAVPVEVRLGRPEELALEVVGAFGGGSGHGARAALGEDLVAARLGPAARVLLSGGGAIRYETQLTASIGALAPELSACVAFAGGQLLAPPAAFLAGLGRERALAGTATSPFAIEALYLRGPDAIEGSWAGRGAT